MTQNTSYTYKAYSDSGCTAANELATETFVTRSETTPPSVVTGGYSPADNATDVATNANLVLTFNETVQKGTGNIVIRTGTNTDITIGVTTSQVSIGGTDNKVVTINPTNDLNANTAYRVRIAAGAIRDSSNNDYAGINDDTTWNFETGRPDPALAADQVTQTGATLTIANYLGGSVTNWYFKADKAPHNTCSAAQTSAAAALSGLTQNTSYTYKAYSDSGCTAANELATETFVTTADTTPPSVVTGGYSPADNTTNVATNANLVLTFNETVQKGTGNIVIRTGTNTDITIGVTTSQVSIGGTDNKVVTINPTNDLNANTAYRVRIAAGAIKDSANNDYAGINNDTTWNFETAAAPDTTPPSVVSGGYTPADGATGVAVGANLVLVFDESVSVKSGAGMGISVGPPLSGGGTRQFIDAESGAVSISADGRTVTINPPNDLGADAAQSVRINGNVFWDGTNDYAGINDDTTWNFRTAAPDPGQPTGGGDSSAPPVFEERSYRFELPENADGRRRAVALGTVAAEDPDGEAVTYALSGGGGRFAVGSSDGAVTYTGPGEDYESDTNRYELTVRARDPDGEEARAEVVVEVTDVNEAPSAGDDAASVAEDERVVVDVLANDTDPDSDRLRVTSVSAPSHGTARAVSNGRVAYVPEADYLGTDRFTYVVSDGGGLTAEAAVEITVTTANDPPKPVGVMPDQTLDEGGEAASVDVAPYFEDVDGDALAYRASSSDPSVAAVAVAGSALTLTPISYGSAVVTVTAEDGAGLSAEQTFVAGVSDRLARGVVTDTLAGMARGHLASARMTLGRRVSAGGGDGGSRLTVLGRSAPLDRASAEAAAAQLLSGWGAGAGHRAGLGAPGAGYGATGLGAAPPGGTALATPAGPAGFGSAGGPGGVAAGGNPLSAFGAGMDPLRGSEFQLTLGGGQEATSGTRAGRRWLVWGQGDIQTFEGAPSSAAGYEGEVRTAYIGVDTGLSERWLAGLALSRGSADGDWRAGSVRGALSAHLTAAWPYVQWSDGSSSVWATAGAGWGTAANVRETGRAGTSDLGLRLGLVEVRRSLDRPGGFEFGVRADAAWAQLRIGAGEETVDGQTAAVNQLRAGVEVSRPVRWNNGSFSPFGEAHARRDAGAGQTGTGLEVVVGTRLAQGWLRVDAQGRLLALHSASGYRERGVAVMLGIGSQDREGLSLSVSPRWGDAATGGGTLWQEQVWRSTLPEAADEWALDARGEYGMRLPGGRLLTWFGSLSQSAWGRRFSVGGQVGAFGDGLLSGK